MSLSALASRRLHTHLEQYLIEKIISGEYAPGQRLPSERDLATALQVSRGSLRQALVALEVMGVVEIRTGSGVYITESAVSIANRMPAPFADEIPPLDILSSRKLVETEAAILAAQMASDEQLRRIDKAAKALEQNDRRYDLRHPADRQFHIEIAKASGNKAIAQLVEELWNMQRGRLYQRLEDHFSTAPMRDYAIRDHASIVRALLARDPDQAGRMMSRHLERVYINLATSSLSIADPDAHLAQSA